jgi:DNA-binding MarR family transcriptional regulator
MHARSQTAARAAGAQPGEQASLEPSLVYLFGRVNQGIRRELRGRLARFELSVPEFTALSILARRGQLSNAQLARRTMITPQAMLESLGKLEARGLVRRRVDPEHGRILRAELTARGRRLIDQAETVTRELEAELLDGLAEPARAVLLEALLLAMERLRSGLDGA